jgi:hypothetical protein
LVDAVQLTATGNIKKLTLRTQFGEERRKTVLRWARATPVARSSLTTTTRRATGVARPQR